MFLRYGEKVDTLFLHEAEMANVLRHKNMLSIYGAVTGSSYSPDFALVSLITKSFSFYKFSCRNLAEQRRLNLVKPFLLGIERKRRKTSEKLFSRLARAMLDCVTDAKVLRMIFSIELLRLRYFSVSVWPESHA